MSQRESSTLAGGPGSRASAATEEDTDVTHKRTSFRLQKHAMKNPWAMNHHSKRLLCWLGQTFTTKVILEVHDAPVAALCAALWPAMTAMLPGILRDLCTGARLPTAPLSFCAHSQYYRLGDDLAKEGGGRDGTARIARQSTVAWVFWACHSSALALTCSSCNMALQKDVTSLGSGRLFSGRAQG